MLAASLISLLTILSSVQAAPANLTKRASGKAGISWPIQEGSAAPVQAFFGSGSHVNWWFNWNKNYKRVLFPADTRDAQVGGEFIPMMFDTSFLNNGHYLQNYDYLMGYNEPDHNDPTTSTASSPQAAGDNWKHIVDQVKGEHPNLQMISPAMAGDTGWLSQFFGHVCPGGLGGCKYAPQYVAVHAYTTSVQTFQDIVTGYHKAFGLPVIVSEFACFDFGTGGTPSQQQVYDFMGATTKWLDDTDWVYKYAWFGANRNPAYLYGVAATNKLMDAGGNLTPLGQQYVNGGHR